jgi:hypothetical protein
MTSKDFGLGYSACGQAVLPKALGVTTVVRPREGQRMTTPTQVPTPVPDPIPYTAGVPIPMSIEELLRTPVPLGIHFRILAPLLILVPISMVGQMMMWFEMPEFIHVPQSVLVQVVVWFVTVMLTVTEIHIAVKNYILYVAERKPNVVEEES